MMKNLSSILIAMSLILSIHGCKTSEEIHTNPPNLRPLSAPEQSISTANGDFAFRLLKNVVGDSDVNVFISPISVSSALGMTLNGAEGETLDGILQAINFEGLAPTEVNQAYKDLTGLLTTMDNTTELKLANGVWYADHFSVNPALANEIADYYDGKVEALTTADAINSWVENQTDHHIKNLLARVDDVVMILINAIYFKGEWASRFDKDATKPGDFITSSGATATTDIMHGKRIPANVLFNNDVTMLDLPYGNGQFSMTILMPNETRLSAFTGTLTKEKLDSWYASATEQEIDVSMPKFKMDWKAKLNRPLATMGMSTAFSDNASFPYLFTNVAGGLRISYVLHQSFIEVDEEGSVAAAATAVGITFTSAPPTTRSVDIDHPFVFLIREKHTGVILFMGQFAKPVNP